MQTVREVHSAQRNRVLALVRAALVPRESASSPRPAGHCGCRLQRSTRNGRETRAATTIAIARRIAQTVAASTTSPNPMSSAAAKTAGSRMLFAHL